MEPGYVVDYADAHASFPNHGNYQDALRKTHTSGRPGSPPRERPEDILQAQAVARQLDWRVT